MIIPSRFLFSCYLCHGDLALTTYYEDFPDNKDLEDMLNITLRAHLLIKHPGATARFDLSQVTELD